MTGEEHANLIERIRNAENEVTRNEALLELSTDYKNMLAQTADLTQKNESLENEKTEYAKLNNNLFMQLNQQQKQVQVHRQEQEQEQEQEPKLTYENLFKSMEV